MTLKLINKVLAAARAYSMFPENRGVLCGISGGADSTAMLYALISLREELGISEIIAAHFNHTLRGQESEDDAAFVSELAHSLGITLLTGRADVAGEARLRRSGLEETARSMRYEFFEQARLKAGCDRIVTGHTADDNAETVLMNLTRGSGLSGMCGIPPVRGRIARPLIQATRKDVLEYLDSRRAWHVEDSSNSNTEFTRNRIRHNVLSQLREINPDVTGAINSFAELARRDSDYISSQVGIALLSARRVEEGLAIDAAFLAGLHIAISSRLCRSLCEIVSEDRCELDQSHVANILELALSPNPSAMLHLPGGVAARRIYTDLVFCAPESAAPDFEPISISPGEIVELAQIGLSISCSVADNSENMQNDNLYNTFFIRRDNIKSGLVVRPRREGDKIRPLGRGVTKSLKKFYIENKIPAHLRSRVPVLADGGNVVAVPGLGLDESYAATPDSHALRIDFSVLNQ